MTDSPRSHCRRRAGFTLLEVMLAMAIGVLLLAALYNAVAIHYSHTQASKQLIEQSNLARSLLDRIGRDIQNSLSLGDASRFRMAQTSAAATSGSGTSSGTSSAASSPTTPATGTSGTSSGSGTSTPTASTASSINPPVQLPLGLIGDSTTMSLVVSRVPREIWPKNPNDVVPTVSDLRILNYWLIENTGLARQEIKGVISQDVLTNLALQQYPSDNQYLMAEEVRSLTFRYWDGTNWQDTWDCTTLGADGITPIGAPLAIEIQLGLLPPKSSPNQDLLTYRHVVAIKTANGAVPLSQAQAQNGQSPTTGSGSTP